MGLGRPLMGWGKRGRGEEESSGLMAEEEEEAEGEEEEENEEEEQEEEEEEEATEPPTNQTDTNINSTESVLGECQIANREISCRGIAITYLPVIHDLEATQLDVAENNIKSLAPQDFSGLPNLETLDLSKNKLDDESFSDNPLSNLTFLKKLNLDGNLLTRIPLLPPSLEELRINSNRLSTLTPHCFQGLVNLLNVELGENTLHEGSVSPLAFKPLERLLLLHLDNNYFRSLPRGLPSSLQRLMINKNLIEEVPEDALRSCVHLRALDLSHNLLREQGIATHAWTHLKFLEVLDLSYNHFTSVPMNLPRPLLKLSLQHNNISHILAFTFRHLQPGLQSLHLSHNALSNEGIEQLSFVGTYRSLGELALDNNRLGEVPRCVRQFKNLQVLRLDNNQIRLVRQWGVCHPGNSGTTLASVHLENNLLDVEKIPPNAFSCLTHAQGLVLHPQQGNQYDQWTA
ncbi:extracellular matrix protein 2 [Anabas testudineus]|uniref:extracellular matrix protein 2 n=1 Tax=Anabas testudineus TaxID=64144 RepID=UPI000E4654E3|nr:extracellular matrix protein 2 [Anabas testudineus]